MSGVEADAVVTGSREGQNWACGYPTEGDVIVARHLRWHHADPDGAGAVYQILLADTGLVIGGIGFKAPPNAAGRVEVGYGIVPEYQGRGLATEALKALLDAVSDDPAIALVIAEVEDENVASRRVAEKVGMHLTRVEGDCRYYEWSS
jgi:RimJ/RimL family protein N-acetyltransferase